MDRLSNAARDASARRDELRDAEAELREAQSELTVQSKAYAEIINSKEKEMRKDADAAQRALAVVKRQVEQKQEVVNRLRKEIATMSNVVEPTAQPADDASAALPSIKAGIAQIEEQMQRHAEAFRREAAGHEAALARLRADAAPRQIEALQPGLVLEVAPLKVGSTVASDTVLGRLTTRQAWEVECKLSPAQLATLRPGQEINIVTVNSDGSTMRLRENLHVTNAQVDRPHISLLSSRDDWHDGTPVRIETSVVKCTLLDEWIAEIRQTVGI
jgi:multidrug resistance efflux pump